MDSSEWRSQDANSDFGLDDSIASTINTSFMSSNSQRGGNSSFTSEEGLLDALSNLSIESARKPRRSERRSSPSDPNLDSSYEDGQNLSSNTQIDVSINNTVIYDPSKSTDVDEKLTDDQTSDNPISESQEVTQNDYLPETDTTKNDTSCNKMIDIPTNEHQESVSDFQTTSDNTGEQKNTKQDVVINDKPINSDNKSIPDCDQKNMNININANKSISALNQSTKKGKPASPSLLPKPKPRNIGSSLDQSVSKVSVTKPATKHVVKTIIDTNDGIHVKEEQINHFGIPVIAGRKKRTEVQPFSFLAREKSTSITSKTSGLGDRVIGKVSNGTADKIMNKTSNATNSKIMNKSISGMTHRMMNKTLISTSDKLVNKTLTAKRISIAPSRVMDKSIKKPVVPNTTKTFTKSLNKITTKVNQENKTPNVIPKPKTQVAPKPTGVTGPPKLHTDKRAKERHEFDVQIRQKQLEIDRLKVLWEEKQLEKEKLEELALRKTMEPKAHPMPEFKAPVPIKSSKVLTVPQSPATWAHNHKK